jgi:CDP-diacylglycerol--serine O-phosphatidyltransferase
MNLHLPKPRIRKPHVSLRAVFPNLLTTIALCSGLASLHFSTNGKWDQALACITVAAIFDTLDGRAARLLRVSSKFGAVLDSLSDFLCFGVAPALMLHQWLLEEKEFWGLAACMTYALCAALRLARFTAAAPPRPEEAALGKFFTGMPSPAAAGAVLIPVMLAQSEIIKFRFPDPAVIAYTFFIGWLMVSRRPMFSFKKIKVHRQAVVPLLALIGVLVFAATKHPWLVASGIAGVYLLTLPLAHVMHAKLVASLRAQGVLLEPHDAPAAASEPSSTRDVSGSRT